MAAYPWEATPDAVALVIPQRTGDITGLARGVFSAATVPTLAQVQLILDSVAAEVAAFAGTNPSGVALAMATWASSIGAAAQIELSFFPDESMASTGPAAVLDKRFHDLLVEIEQVLASGGAAGPAPARWSFPATVETGAGTTSWERF